jgi:hypothetical protein
MLSVAAGRGQSVESGAASVYVCSSGFSAEGYKIFRIHAVIGWIALHVLESDSEIKRGITVLCSETTIGMWQACELLRDWLLSKTGMTRHQSASSHCRTVFRVRIPAQSF